MPKISTQIEKLQTDVALLNAAIKNSLVQQSEKKANVIDERA